MTCTGRTRPRSAATVAALDPAVSARLVYPADSRAGTYRFVHALFRDAVEEQLAPSRRAELHARAFGALRDTGWGQASDLAHHAVHGRPGVSDSVAAAAARSAAEAADRLLAWEDAAAWWRTVIVLTQRSGRVDPELEMRLGRSLLLAGQIEARGCTSSRPPTRPAAAATGLRWPRAPWPSATRSEGLLKAAA